MKHYTVRRQGHLIGLIAAKNLREAETEAIRKYGRGVTVTIS